MLKFNKTYIKLQKNPELSLIEKGVITKRNNRVATDFWQDFSRFYKFLQGLLNYIF